MCVVVVVHLFQQETPEALFVRGHYVVVYSLGCFVKSLDVALKLILYIGEDQKHAGAITYSVNKTRFYTEKPFAHFLHGNRHIS